MAKTGITAAKKGAGEQELVGREKRESGLWRNAEVQDRRVAFQIASLPETY